MRTVEVDITTPQAEFFKLRETCLYPLFNAGYGSGKTNCMTKAAVMDASHSTLARIGIYEPTYSHITDIAMPEMEAFLTELEIPYQPNYQRYKIKTDGGMIGDFIFKSMEKPDTLVGYETYTGHIDEIDVLSFERAQKAWQKILGRTRQQPADLPHHFKVLDEETKKLECRHSMAAYSTPEGFNYTYAKWGLNRSIPDGDIFAAATWKKPEYRYLMAASSDNWFLEDSVIKGWLEDFPSELIKAYIKGQWVNLASGTVYHAYDETAHNTRERVLKDETLYVGCDFNVRNMSAVICVKRKGGKELHALDEIVGEYDTPNLIEELQRRYPKNRIRVYPDATGESENSIKAGITNILLLKKAFGNSNVIYDSKNPYVADRVSCVNRCFEQLKLFISLDGCPNLSSCLKQQAYGKNNKPDKTKGHDHLPESLGYAVNKIFPLRQQIIQLPVRWAG